MVFQNYALYPHMRVWDNLAFALKLRRTPKPALKEQVDAVAGVLGLTALIDRKPGALSGGQRQRVAIGRAMVREPQAYLMDEPLSNLDAKLRVGMRAELARLHRRLGVTTVYVTHDQVEAMTLGDRVAVMRDGTVQQCDTPERLFESPANVFVAAFMGSPAMNLVAGDVRGGRLALRGHRAAARRRAVRDGAVIAGVRPGDLLPADGEAERRRTAADGRARGGRAARHGEPPHLPRRRRRGPRARRRRPRTRRSRTRTRRCSPPTTARASPRASRGGGASRPATPWRSPVPPDAVHLFDPASGEALALSATPGTRRAGRCARVRRRHLPVEPLGQVDRAHERVRGERAHPVASRRRTRRRRPPPAGTRRAPRPGRAGARAGPASAAASRPARRSARASRPRACPAKPGTVPRLGTLTGSVSPRSLNTASMQSIASSSSWMPPRERRGSSSGASSPACSV